MTTDKLDSVESWLNRASAATGNNKATLIREALKELQKLNANKPRVACLHARALVLRGMSGDAEQATYLLVKRLFSEQPPSTDEREELVNRLAEAAAMSDVALAEFLNCRESDLRGLVREMGIGAAPVGSMSGKVVEAFYLGGALHDKTPGERVIAEEQRLRRQWKIKKADHRPRILLPVPKRLLISHPAHDCFRRRPPRWWLFSPIWRLWHRRGSRTPFSR